MCTLLYHGNDCELNRHYIQLTLKDDAPRHRAAVVQYLEIDPMTLDLLLLHQQLYEQLPRSLFYIHRRAQSADIRSRQVIFGHRDEYSSLVNSGQSKIDQLDNVHRSDNALSRCSFASVDPSK